MNFGIRSVKNQFSFIRSCYQIYYIKRKKPDTIELFMKVKTYFDTKCTRH